MLWLGVLSASLGGYASGQSQEGIDAEAVNNAPTQYPLLYLEHCAVCHGERFEGAAQGTPLIGELNYGDTQADIERNIVDGFVERGMPAWSNTLSEDQIRNLALYVTETRAGLNYADFKYNAAFEVPTQVLVSERHRFRLETIIDDLDPAPFSITPMPDGRLLLTEKKLGLSIVSMDGTRSDLIRGTPQAYDDTFILSENQEWGYGWMMDVALHPDYAENQWVYLHFTDRCSACNEASRSAEQPVSMNKVVRGRIRDGAWVDEETIWAADKAYYGVMPDVAAGGRLAFDEEGHLFISVGTKGSNNYHGIQDLSTPWGKIHRVFENGEIPLDNPFIETEGAYKSTWTYGHRSPQGLEFRRQTGELWSTEMGPRGGDEVNRLLPGRNYGWPLYSKGMNYDGTSVAYGQQLGIEFDLKDIEQPVVDLTPSPAVSSFVFYEGEAFPAWQGQILVGSLKGRSLFRMVLEDNQLTHQETLLSDLARIRDIEVGTQGEIYLLLENNSGGQVVRIVPGTPNVLQIRIEAAEL